MVLREIAHQLVCSGDGDSIVVPCPPSGSESLVGRPLKLESLIRCPLHEGIIPELPASGKTLVDRLYRVRDGHDDGAKDIGEAETKETEGGEV